MKQTVENVHAQARTRTADSDESPSARAGANQAQLKAGAPGNGAARVTKTQERKISGGAARTSITPVTGGGKALSAGIKTKATKRVAKKTGARTADCEEEEGVKPPSTVLQLSKAQSSG